MVPYVVDGAYVVISSTHYLDPREALALLHEAYPNA